MTIRRSRGFTLIELLVVIAIIAVLMGILFPVFATVRKKARMSHCQSNLHQLAGCLKAYRADYGRYPNVPYYDTAALRYFGGFSALSPDYVNDKRILLCPSDRQIKGREEDAKRNSYSSYNGWVDNPTTSWDFATGNFSRADDQTAFTGPTRYYNFYGYCQEGTDPHFYVDPTTNNVPYLTTVPTWLSNEGLRQRHYPRLSNRYAPDNTYITHCVHHRADYGRPASRMDIYATVNASAKVVNVSQMEHIQGGASRWVKQQD